MRALVLASAALLAAGCGSAETAPPSVTTTAETVPAAQRMPLTVFRVRGGVLRPVVVLVPRTKAVAAAALAALDVSATVAISGGTASVDLPKATGEQVAEIVYSLTQFRSVRRVDVAGRTGLTRADVAAYVPPILLEQPAPGARVSARFRVAGTASVFEATLVVEAVRDGVVLDRQTVTASEGAPGRGTFDTTLHATPGRSTVRAYAPSAADGAPQHEVQIEVEVVS
jgi:immunoglobulin-like protein involved in spore germination